MIDFFNPELIDSQQMDKITYANEKVIEFVNEKVIPLRVHSNHPLVVDFHIEWTPALIILDQTEENNIDQWVF